MKILIADDERLVRFSLKSMLEEIGVPARSILAAVDGEEMLQAAARSAPDVAFVDIRMPRLDGLAGIERGREISPGTRWVVLTSHSSFEYAKKAIELGAAGYLLKPVSPEDLRRVLAKLEADRRKELSRSNEEFERRVTSLLHNTLSPSDRMEFISDARFLGCLLVLDAAEDAESFSRRRLAACSEARARLAATMDARFRACLCVLRDETAPRSDTVSADEPLAVVAAWKSGPEEALAHEALLGFIKTLQSVLDSAGGDEARATLLVGSPAASLSDLRMQLVESMRLSPLRVALGIGRLIRVDEAREASRGAWARLCVCLAETSSALRGRNRLEFFSAVERARKTFAEAERPRDFGDETVSRRVERFLRFSLGVRLRVSGGDDGWLNALEARGRTIETREGGEGSADLVEQAVSFARAHFRESLGIARVARRLGVTPNYLSSLFHKKQGITFVKYVTRLRMQAARELLAAGIRVQDAARAVGYSSVRYFSATFRRHFGSHPSRIGEKSP